MVGVCFVVAFVFLAVVCFCFFCGAFGVCFLGGMVVFVSLFAVGCLFLFAVVFMFLCWWLVVYPCCSV